MLSELALHDVALAGLLSSTLTDGALSLSTPEAEQVRDFLTVRLAEVGFDEDYRPNRKGALIERMIDRLYVNS